MKMLKLPKAPEFKIPKFRSVVYKPSWKQMNKKKGSGIGGAGIVIPPIKIKSDWK